MVGLVGWNEADATMTDKMSVAGNEYPPVSNHLKPKTLNLYYIHNTKHNNGLIHSFHQKGLSSLFLTSLRVTSLRTLML
jgi:hypothetical protein